MKAFIFDPIWDSLVNENLKDALDKGGVEIVVIKEIAPLSDCAELFEGDEDRILCLNPDYVGWKLTPDDYKDIPNLKGIFGEATSFSWVDTSYASEHGIPVCNVRDFSTQAVAEWAVTMMCNLARQTPRLIKDGFPLDHDKDYMKYRGIELHDKKVGIIGMGHIGAAIAKRCSGLGMEVTYWSKSAKVNDYQSVELNKLLAESDVIFPTMALNDETKKILTDDLLMSMKTSAIFVAIEHHLFDVPLLINMVKDGKLFGFGFEAEACSFDKYEGNVWAAPEYAWVTEGSMNNAMSKWVENMINAAQGKFPNRVN